MKMVDVNTVFIREAKNAGDTHQDQRQTQIPAFS